MATTVARLEAVLGANTRDFDRGMDRAESRTHKVGHAFATFGKTAAIAGGAAGVGALAYGLKVGIDEFMTSQKEAAQTAAVIKSTGGVAHVTGKQVAGLSESLMKMSGVDDELITKGENMLLTFTNVRNEVGKGNDIFTQGTKAMFDMSVAMGTDTKTSAIILGKALNDPTRGMTALRRVGVTFSDAQETAIKKMQKTGDLMGAQKVVLKELNKEFGGSAKALGQTLGGQINIVRERFNNWAGDMVQKALPAVKKFITDATPLFNQLVAFITGTVLPAVGKFIGFVRDHMPEIKQQIGLMWDAVKPILKNLSDLVITVVGLIRKHWGTIGPIISQVVGIIRTQLAIVSGIIKFFAALLKGDWSAAWDALKGIVRNVFKALKAILDLQLDILKQAAVAIGHGIVAGIKAGLAAAADGLEKAVKGLFHKVIGWVKDVLGIKSPSQVFHSIGVNMIKGMVNGVGSMGGYLKKAVVNLVSKIPHPHLGFAGGHSWQSGLVDQVRNAVIYAQSQGWQGHVTSGFRTYAEQAALYQRYLNGGPLAARPGTSSHESGQAVDVTDYQTFGAIMARAPAAQRLYNHLGAADPVHFSVSGYDKGGWLMPGATLAVNNTGRPERVLGPGDGGSVVFNFPNYVGSRTELMSWLRDAATQFQRNNGRPAFGAT